ncbi:MULTISPECIES: alpha/beta fold hydrolase [unclassified Wenzhouxiangella]|uniref:alpha/beta fold hydrolase n=1 Tax=unclassified Wenzhouxiangella TaxID=2613841 RepID=UPI0015F26E3B|nr:MULTISPECIES: alpha/beta fold hydrolase [unclassified Wenzhouxiangella]
MARQQVRIAHTEDGVRLAWSRVGAGPTLLKAANWLTHLQYDWESPVWRHWMEFLAGHFSFVRYDERGCGMSDWQVDDVSEDNWLSDMECVAKAAEIDEPAILLGISQGAVTVIRYAVEHPERVSKLILYGGYGLGWGQRGGREDEHFHAVLEMIRLGWGSDNPVFRQTFTSRFLPEGTHEQMDWFNELCRRTVSPDKALPLIEARGGVDIRHLLDKVRVPTLVLHARGDEVVPFAEGQRLAGEIPGARFVELDSRNHVLQADEPAWEAFKQAVLDFSGVTYADEPSPDDRLSTRERQILDVLARGVSNKEIARTLYISEKTVRNHLSSVYRKMGVHSRTQAIVKAGRMTRSGQD